MTTTLFTLNSLTSVDYIAQNENGPGLTKIMDEPLMYSGPKEAALRERKIVPPRGYNVHCIILLVFAFYCAVHFTEYLVSQTSSRLGTVNCAMYKSHIYIIFTKANQYIQLFSVRHTFMQNNRQSAP